MAGLSLAYHLCQSDLCDKSLLIIDPVIKNQNDRTWCSWLREPAPFDSIAYRVWEQIAFAGYDKAGNPLNLTLPIAPYRYRMVRGLDFYHHTQEMLKSRHNVHFLQETVHTIADSPQMAQVTTDTQTYISDWVFDSRFLSHAYRVDTRHYQDVKQHFKGWTIETATPVFNPQTVTMFDFRTPQNGAMRFFYILPFSATRALVEYTLFSSQILNEIEYTDALKTYINTVLGATHYTILEEEADIIPMTDQPFPRRAGHRVLNIGTRGGRVKAATGFAFHRTQQDAAAIVRSLVRHGHPFALPEPPPRYHLFDAMLLYNLAHHGDLGLPIFSALFNYNPIDRLFRFLDEEGDVWENLQLMASVPPLPFIKAWIKLNL